MAKLPDKPADSLTVQAIYKAYEDRRKPRFQRRLGASQIGGPCDRKLWYGFRWYAQGENFSGQMLRLFETGSREEQRFADNLRAIGCDVHLNAGDGNQFEFVTKDGHLVCKIDGAAVGVIEAPKTWHVLEFKTHNEKSFKEIKSKGIRVAKFEHYAQCVVGMVLSGMSRCLYLAVNKNNDELYSERLRIEECKDDADAILNRAKTIIEAAKPPERYSDDPDDWTCKYCEFRGVCHDADEPLATCRSCRFSAAADKGDWVCTQHNKTLTFDEQQRPCKLYEIIVETPEYLAKQPGVPI